MTEENYLEPWILRPRFDQADRHRLSLARTASHSTGARPSSHTLYLRIPFT